MRITKYEHACLDIREGGSRLVIDPGVFSDSLTDFANINAVVVTHVHGDHFDPEKLKKIITDNPSVRIFTTQQVMSEFSDHTELAQPGKEITIGDIKLEFFGKQHHLFNDIQNIGVFVNNQLYYPGDSYTMPSKSVEVLAMPASAPWFRIDEAKTFLSDVKPTHAFPTHNALLSKVGESIHYRILGEACVEAGSEWRTMKPGDSIEV